MVPDWITEGSKSVRDIIKLACNIIGIIMLLTRLFFIVDVIGVSLE